MTGNTILVVDDDREINELITLSLEREGYQLLSAANGMDAIKLVEHHAVDLILLDVMLPGMDGFQICSELRKTSDVPIVFVSCKDEVVEKALGLGLGGDDYIAKPFSPIELVARVKAHLRRNYILQNKSNNPSHEETQLLEFENIVINQATHQVLVNQTPVSLSAKEFKLLFHLAQNPNRVFKNDQLFSILWDDVHMGDTHTVMVHIYNLRKKLEENPSKPEFIRTIRGVGYKFNDKPLVRKKSPGMP